MGKVKIKLEKDLMDKVKKYTKMAGYSSPEEFITHCLEKEISKLDESDSEEEIKKHNGEFVSEVPMEERRPKPIEEVPKEQLDRRDKFTPVMKKILRYVKINPGVNLKTAYISLGVSHRRGNFLRNKLESMGLIESREIATDSGKEVRLYLAEKGEKALDNKYTQQESTWTERSGRRSHSRYDGF